MSSATWASSLSVFSVFLDERTFNTFALVKSNHKVFRSTVFFHVIKFNLFLAQSSAECQFVLYLTSLTNLGKSYMGFVKELGTC